MNMGRRGVFVGIVLLILVGCGGAGGADCDVVWTRFKWPELIADLRAGQFDVAADGITVRPERSVAGRFTVPIARGGAVLLLRRPSWAGALRR